MAAGLWVILSLQTVHGDRGLASSGTNEAECYRPAREEMALAHADRDDVRGAYNNALCLTSRQRILQAQARYAMSFIAVPQDARIA